MRQLVGLKCVICHERINDILQGEFCDGCHNPIHRCCAETGLALPGEERCHRCGVDVSEADALTATDSEERRLRAAPRRGYPVSLLCPKCGHAEFKRRKAEKWIAFTADRVCTACGTRYTPPTPAWAGVTFILAGFPLAGIGLVSIILWLATRGTAPALPALACEGFLGFLGFAAIIHGIRSLVSPGRI